VAAQHALADPPWPVLGVLTVLILAVGAAALATRRGAIHAGSLVGAGVVLIALAATAREAPWPRVAILAAAGAALLGLAFSALARRRLGSDSTGVLSFDLGAAASLVLAQVVALVAATGGQTRLGLGVLLPAHLAFVLGLLLVAWVTDRHVIAELAIPLAFLAAFFYGETISQPPPSQRLVFYVALLAPFLLFPLALGARAKTAKGPYLAAVLANVPFFFLARSALIDMKLGDAIGLLPVAQAALLSVLFASLLKLEPAGKRTLGRLALVAGAVLAFITVAIPLQLDKEWITIGWALEGAALLWLFTRIPHRGLLVWSIGLYAAAFVRLTMNRAVLEYHPRGSVPVLNWYLYTYLVVAAAFFAGARFLKATPMDARLGGGLNAAGAVLVFLLLNVEIADYYATGPVLTFNFTSSSLAQDMTYTLGWALFAIGLLVAGVTAKSRPTRIASIILLVVTVVKAFVHDLGRLGGLYRVASLFGLAMSLALVAVALQKFVLKKAEGEVP
jgi:uncharacterized membrane protein